jgi:L-asparaginase/Glu-tRNA(Gln) amidotransferase subunit D
MAPTNLIAGSNNSQSAMKKIIGGTISHSHKSLRSQSSSRKRVSSVDSNLALGQHQNTNSSNGKRMNNIPSGHMTPDMNSYTNGNNKHSQKSQNILKN